MKGQGRLTLFILVASVSSPPDSPFPDWLPLSCVLMFLAGTALMASASFMVSLAQLITTDAMRGRVMSVYNLAFRAGMPLGGLVLGKLIPLFGVTRTLAGTGVALLLVSLYFLILNRESTFRPASEQA